MRSVLADIDEYQQQRILLAHWVDEHSDALYRYALRKLSDRHIIEDILQETFLAALRAAKDRRGDSSTRTWLVAILRMKIADYYRQRERRREEVGLDERQDWVRESKLKAWDASAANTLENDEFWTVLRACIDKLPGTLSAAYFLREIDGLGVSDVCESLGISSKNLAVRLFRARALLRDCLDANWFHPSDRLEDR